MYYTIIHMLKFKSLILKAINERANYIALGAFFSTKTKKIKYKAYIKTLRYVKNMEPQCALEQTMAHFLIVY